MWRNQYVYLSPSNLAPRALPLLEGGVLDPTPLDVEKWVGWVRFGSSQSGLRVKKGQPGCKSDRVGLPVFFKQVFFFFFKLQKQINDNLFRENE